MGCEACGGVNRSAHASRHDAHVRKRYLYCLACVFGWIRGWVNAHPRSRVCAHAFAWGATLPGSVGAVHTMDGGGCLGCMMRGMFDVSPSSVRTPALINIEDCLCAHLT